MSEHPLVVRFVAASELGPGLPMKYTSDYHGTPAVLLVEGLIFTPDVERFLNGTFARQQRLAASPRVPAQRAPVENARRGRPGVDTALRCTARSTKPHLLATRAALRDVAAVAFASWPRTGLQITADQDAVREMLPACVIERSTRAAVARSTNVRHDPPRAERRPWAWSLLLTAVMLVGTLWMASTNDDDPHDDRYGLAVDLARPASVCVVVVEEPCARKPYQLRPRRPLPRRKA